MDHTVPSQIEKTTLHKLKEQKLPGRNGIMFTVLPYAQVFLGLIDHLLTGATWKKNEIVITDCISLGNLVGNIVGILLGEFSYV
jgi:hypothetical protein